MFEKSWLDKFLLLLPEKPHILDLGCGMGEPIISYLLKNKCRVTGVDGCEKLICIAQKRFPTVQFLLNDFRFLCLKNKFDGIIAWHSIFHLTHEEQKKTLPIVAAHLNDGGSFLFTTGPSSGEAWSDNGGKQLYHASFSYEDYLLLLQKNGFIIIDYKQSDPSCGDATVWLARKDKGHVKWHSPIA